MLGTSLATSPIMSSNFIGTRVFTVGLYSNAYASDTVSLGQNHIALPSGLVSDPITVQTGSMLQTHVLDYQSSLLLPTEVGQSTITQNHVSIPQGVFTEVYIESALLSQIHNVEGRDIYVQPTVDATPIHQNHKAISIGLIVQPTVANGGIIQTHALYSDGVSSNTFVSSSTIQQNHKLNSTALVISSVDITDPVDITQLHNIDFIGLLLDPTKVGKPFVNPSIRRVINASGDSTNAMVINVEKENIVLLYDVTANKYK